MDASITQNIISESEVKKALGRIFSDSIIIDHKHVIVSVGHAICTLLGYSEKQFPGSPLSSLTGNSFAKELTEKLDRGFFDEFQIEVFNIEGISVACKVSGFYLGLVSDINNLIILRFRSTHKEESAQRQLNEKNAEMDEFIYSTSHGMRGPLATIKGLINLLKIHKNVDEEHNFIVSQMSHFANQLDDRLHKLIYFAESDKEHEGSKEQMSLSSIAERLCDHDLDAQMYPNFKFTANISDSAAILDNAYLILSLLRNIKAFFCRRSSKNFDLNFIAASYETFIEFELVANEISINEECRKKIDQVNIGYKEILNDPEYTDLYSAKKIALKLEARMKLQMFGQCIRAHIIIPREKGASIFVDETAGLKN